MKKENIKKEISQQFKNLIAEYKDDLIEVLDGSSFAKSIAKKDKENFDKFKKGSFVSDKDYDYKNMYILSILEGLGFPMDELGTYLYKELILEVGEQLQKIEEDSTIESYNALYDDLNNINSNLYSWVHSDYLEMGKKSFIFYLNQSFEKIDKTKINKDIQELLFGNEEQPDFVFQTVQLGMQNLVYDNYSKKLSYLK
jgi:hypothetical protein